MREYVLSYVFVILKCEKYILVGYFENKHDAKVKCIQQSKLH